MTKKPQSHFWGGVLIFLYFAVLLILAASWYGASANTMQQSFERHAPPVHITTFPTNPSLITVSQFDHRTAGGFAPAADTQQPAAAEECRQLLGNTTLDVVDGSIAPWGVFTPKVYYSTQDYVSPQYSLVLPDADSGDETPTQDALGQFFDMPANLTSVTIQYHTATGNANATDKTAGNLWTADANDQLVDFIGGWDIPDSAGAWARRTVSIEDSAILAAMAGQRMAIILYTNTDGQDPGEAVFFDDVTLTACTGAAATATPTNTPTNTPTSTPTSTPTGTAATSTPTPTSTSRPITRPDQETFLPYIAQRPPVDIPQGITLRHDITDENGSATFRDLNANVQVRAVAKDLNNNPIPRLDVHFMSNGNTGRLLYLDPNLGSGDNYFLPLWRQINYPGGNRDVQDNAILRLRGSGAYGGHKLGDDPPRIDLEVGYQRVCMTYPEYRNTASNSDHILSISTLNNGDAFWHASKRGGLAAVENLVNQGSELIEEWNPGGVTGWNGQWCFRQSYIDGHIWWAPETDEVRSSGVFRAELRWNTNATDVDLHVYDSFGNHAYFANKTGVPGGALDRDDVDGFGPEVYTQFTDQGASYYDIKVFYYSDHGHGPSTAYVDVYDGNGRLMGSFQRTLSHRQWWDVFRVTVRRSQLVVTELNTLTAPPTDYLPAK